jgi:hypothetical protein
MSSPSTQALLLSLLESSHQQQQLLASIVHRDMTMPHTSEASASGPDSTTSVSDNNLPRHDLETMSNSSDIVVVQTSAELGEQVALDTIAGAKHHGQYYVAEGLYRFFVST